MNEYTVDYRKQNIIHGMKVAVIGSVGLLVLFVALMAIPGLLEIDPAAFDRLMAQEQIEEPINTGYELLACGQDPFNAGFKGKKNGRPISGVVCGGVMKGYTIRYF